MATIYDNYIIETDPNFKINSVFFVNCGTHGDFDDVASHKIFRDRVALNKNGADDLGLPMYLVNSNFHAFTHKIGEQKIGYLAIYSCILSLQKYIKRYYTSSNFSYDEITAYAKIERDFDIAQYSESYITHLISTECFELVIDGCQYTRNEKIERICDWEFARKHLNVCVTPIDHGQNCSCCAKCMKTLIPLEAIGKIENFSEVFDLKIYYKNAFWWKCFFLVRKDKAAAETASSVTYAKEHGMKLPPKWVAKIAWFTYRCMRKLGLTK